MVPIASVTALAAASLRGERIVDVRDRHEYVSGHVPGAEWIPLKAIPLRLGEFKGNKPVWVVCESGNRSFQAVGYLSGHGVDAVTIAGGTSAWRSAGMPITKGSSR
ncbi:MAG: rhodanese-like domain-containing protein [Lacisediminihabitans sp.]